MEKHKLNIFPEMLPEDYSRLKNDINENGYDVNYPIWFYEGQILDGWNREKACTELNIEPEYAEFEGSTTDAIEFVLRSNKRRNLTSSQWACIAVEADEIIYTLRREAKERMVSGKLNPTQLIEEGTSGETNAKVADMFNTNRQYVYEAEKLKEEQPEVFQQVKSGEKTITEVKKEEKIKKHKKNIEQQKESIANTEFRINGLYDIIAIDPPWNYGRDYDPDGSRVANPYPEMTFDELSNITIPAENNCVLWLWTTHAFIWDAKKLLEIWGFDYKAILTWNKEKMGMGSWLRMQCEFCLLGIKGSPIWDVHDIRDIINESRREHSRKPEAFYEMINKNFVGKKIEIFSRTERAGWIVEGNDTKKFNYELAR